MRIVLTLCAATALLGSCDAQTPSPSFADDADLDIAAVSVRYDDPLDVLVFDVEVRGEAGATTPEPRGQLDGAPVLGYVVPTTLLATDVGFPAAEGIVALALTSHPDFDDTPLWDEDASGVYDDDGVIWHPHWVLLRTDDRVAGGLSVRQFAPADSVSLPPTNPGMPMFMDSPGFGVAQRGGHIRCVVPGYRVSGKTAFNFDGVAAYMEVNTSDATRPLLGVYEVYSVASGDLSLPYVVE